MLPTYLRHTGAKDEASCPLLGNSKHPLQKEERYAVPYRQEYARLKIYINIL